LLCPASRKLATVIFGNICSAWFNTFTELENPDRM
jgi:hypothetical protein